MVFWLLIPFAACELTRVHKDMEKIIYTHEQTDAFNIRTCKHPSPAEFTFLWTENQAGCIREDHNDFSYASFVGYVDGRKIEVIQEFMYAWAKYKQHAWGADSISPNTGEPVETEAGMMDMIVGNLDTLYMMGLQDQFLDAVHHVTKELKFADRPVHTSWILENLLGGLLAAYDLSENQDLLNKAKELGDAVVQAFNNDEQLPFNLFNLHTQTGERLKNALHMSEATVAIEMLRLSQITGDSKYADAVQGMLDFVKTRYKEAKYLPSYVAAGQTRKMGRTLNDSLVLDPLNVKAHRNIFNTWMFGKLEDEDFRDIYQNTKEFIIRNLSLTNNEGNLFIAEMDERGDLQYRMHTAACGWAGIIAQENMFKEYNSTEVIHAQRLMQTCMTSVTSSKLELPPEYMHFTAHKMFFEEDQSGYSLTSEIFESLFYLSRLTNDVQYRKAGVYLLDMIRKTCKTEFGFSGVTDVNADEVKFDGVMPPSFLSKGLKYLYLLFSSESYLIFNDYIITSEGHPLVIA